MLDNEINQINSIMFWSIQLQNSTSATNLNVRQDDKYHVTLLFRKDTFKFHRNKGIHEKPV